MALERVMTEVSRFVCEVDRRQHEMEAVTADLISKNGIF